MIYRFLDYREAVTQLIEAKKSADKAFNLSTLSIAMGIQRAFISRVMGGDRHFSGDQMYALCAFFALDDDEQDYMLLLLEYARTGLESRRRALHRKIEKIQLRHRAMNRHLAAQMINPDADSKLAKIYADAYSVVVLSFLGLPRYQNDPALIARDLALPSAKLERLLNDFEAAGLVKRQPGTRACVLLKNHFHLEKDSPLALPHLISLRQFAIHQLQQIRADERVAFSLSFTADEKTRVFIHEAFLAFLRQLEPVVSKAPAQDVYQMNFDLFPWRVL